MKAVDMKVLNGRLSKYMRLVALGEIFLATDRGKAIAKIGPPQATQSPILADAQLAEAVRKGWLTPPVLHDAGKFPPPKPVAPFRDLLGELDDDRSER